MTQFKIGLTGVHASGKTTKTKELKSRYIDEGKTVYLVEEAARSSPMPLETVEAQEYIWKHQMAAEKHAMTQDVDVIICDRTVIDNLMYYRAIVEDPTNLHDWKKNFFRWLDLYKEALDWMPTYDQVIRLPLNLEYLKADDPIRSKNVAYAKRIDKLFDRFVDKYVTEWTR